MHVMKLSFWTEKIATMNCRSPWDRLAYKSGSQSIRARNANSEREAGSTGNEKRTTLSLTLEHMRGFAPVDVFLNSFQSPSP